GDCRQAPAAGRDHRPRELGGLRSGDPIAGRRPRRARIWTRGGVAHQHRRHRERRASPMTRVLEVDAERPAADVIAEAAEVIRGGGLVAFPTETVYGLGVNARDAEAVARLFEAKGRPATDPLIVHIAHIGQLGMLASDISPEARALGLKFWAGPLTLIL